MQSIHESLCAHVPWYDRWHKDPHGNAVVWVIFVLVALSVTSLILNQVSSELTVYDDSKVVNPRSAQTVTESGVAQASGMAKPWERLSDPFAKLQLMNDTAFEYLKIYLTEANEARSTALGYMRDVLSERHSLMGQVLSTDPEKAEQYYFGPVTREAIPEGLHVYLEKNNSGKQSVE